MKQKELHSRFLQIHQGDSRNFSRWAVAVTWLTGAACCLTMVLYHNQVFNNTANENRDGKNPAAFSIDQLMLKSDESTQKAFVNGGLRFQEQTNNDTTVLATFERKRIYHEIQQRRINDLNQHRDNPDFSIKPVPR